MSKVTRKELASYIGGIFLVNAPAGAGTYFGLTNDGTAWNILAGTSIAWLVVQALGFGSMLVQATNKSIEQRQAEEALRKLGRD